MQKEKTKLKLRLFLGAIIILGFGIHYYFEYSNIDKINDVTQIKCTTNDGKSYNNKWKLGKTQDGVEVCFYDYDGNRIDKQNYES